MMDGPDTLLVVALPRPADDDAAQAFYRSAFECRGLRVLWFADSDAKAFLARYAGNRPVEIRETAESLHNRLDEFGRQMRDLLHGLLSAAGHLPDVWATRLIEINFADPAWFSILRASL